MATTVPACVVPLPVATTRTVGDNCLAGSWTLTQETNASGYTYAGVAVAVSGLKDETMTITSAGDENTDFAKSEPLIGTLQDGRQLVIKIRGSFHFTIHAASGSYAESGEKTSLATTASVGGVDVPGYSSYYTPSYGTYTCTSSTLVMTTDTDNQVTTWSR